MKNWILFILSLTFCCCANAQTNCASAWVSGHKSGEHIKQEELKNLDTLTIAVQGLPNNDYTIVAFNTKFYISGQAYASAEAGNILSAEAKSYLAKAPKGTMLIFEDIKAKGSDGKAFNVAPVVLTVQ